MGLIANASPENLRRLIANSNQQSLLGTQGYVRSENFAILSGYELSPCGCENDCWCKRNACAGHYRIKEMSFEQFLATFTTLWIPPNSREIVASAVLLGTSFNGRQRNAIEPLRMLRRDWISVLGTARTYDKCGLCDGPPPKTFAVSNLYQAKIWSQLYYDSIVPYDTLSAQKIRRAGYPSPMQDFAGMNAALFADLRSLSDKHELGVSGLRELDLPWMDVSGICRPVGGQPLSRVVDKIFYTPRPAANESATE